MMPDQSESPATRHGTDRSDTCFRPLAAGGLWHGAGNGSFTAPFQEFLGSACVPTRPVRGPLPLADQFSAFLHEKLHAALSRVHAVHADGARPPMFTTSERKE
jgi:hypothetical protein